MSVILFDQTKINKLLGVSRYHHDEIAQVVRYSPYFTHYYSWLSKLKKDIPEEQVIEEFISRMLWYAIVANKVAFALQYHEEINLADVNVDYQSAIAMNCSKKQFFTELQHLIYNMHTNDGNMFMEQKWFEPLQSICNSLAHSMMYAN